MCIRDRYIVTYSNHAKETSFDLQQSALHFSIFKDGLSGLYILKTVVVLISLSFLTFTSHNHKSNDYQI